MDDTLSQERKYADRDGSEASLEVDDDKRGTIFAGNLWQFHYGCAIYSRRTGTSINRCALPFWFFVYLFFKCCTVFIIVPTPRSWSRTARKEVDQV